MRHVGLTLMIAGGCIVAGAAALSVGRPVSDRPAASVLEAGPRVVAPSPWQTRTDTIQKGETLLAVLLRAGISTTDGAAALLASREIDSRRIRAGTAIETRVHVDSGPAEISFHLAIDRIVRLRRDNDSWTEHDERLPWTTDTVGIAGVVRSSLTEAIATGALAFPAPQRSELAYALADILEYRVDLSRDLRQGDSVFVLIERRHAPNGAIKAGHILAARITIDGRPVETVRFTTNDQRSTYFDGEGKSMRAAFLRAPLAFRRISSVFGMRRHPILNTVRQHAGMDYAAAAGTPVRALGDGVVIFAGWRGGYGRTLEIRHRNGYVTRYAHLNGFAKGISRGTQVSISRTIGYVGATGLATAPHLHFEVLVGGVHRDPRVALRNVTGEPLGTRDKAAFAALRSALFERLDAEVTSGATLAAYREGE